MVRVADCVPLVLADAEAGVIAAVHSGRPGMVLDIATRTVEVMREHGATHITAWLGPHVCGRCYEVPAAMRDEVAAAVPESWAETSWGTPAVDIGAGVRAQLARAGVVGRRRRRLHGRGPRPALLPTRRRGLRSLRRPGVALRAGPAAPIVRTGRRHDAAPDELAANLAAVRRRIEVACEAAGRDAGRRGADRRHEVLPRRRRADPGRPRRHRRGGEPPPGGRAPKVAECADLSLRWHFIGGLQSNKAAAVAAYADVVESLDRAKLVAGLQRGAHERGSRRRRAPAGQPRSARRRAPLGRRPRRPGRPGGRGRGGRSADACAA